jgi:hypothetical protein
VFKTIAFRPEIIDDAYGAAQLYDASHDKARRIFDHGVNHTTYERLSYGRKQCPGLVVASAPQPLCRGVVATPTVTLRTL